MSAHGLPAPKGGTLTGCLFDLDGVLVDTAKYHYLAWREIAGELGFAFTEKDNERLKGVSRMRSLDILLEIGGLSMDGGAKARLAERKNAVYLQYVLKMRPNEVLPGAREFLADCRSRGLKVALVSASKNATKILDLLGLTSLFDVIVDGNQVAEAKPDPEVFLTAARALGLHPRNCIVFEDAEAGIEGAIAAGMVSVGVGSSAILKKANIVVAGLRDLSVKALVETLEHLPDRHVPAATPTFNSAAKP
ncbi:MAG: beta-phosphoglucomutase [Alphaproteobacteria bacterium]|nr:beta-phosphoglucomutase [Alphaproteobacteria bacterium]MDE2111849.1 beta-phosphoglucomutase [Alphaproteobacteria bacterium]MDE2493589.1 beta-phosphoglucomutase [Alphaproteobacteria bacterium]